MVDTQWNILYWGSRWIFHATCWGGVGCEWGKTYVYLGLPMFALSLYCFLYLPWAPSTNIDFCIDVKNIIWRTKHTIFEKFHVVLEPEWPLWDKCWLSWKHLQFEVFFRCRWPLSDQWSVHPTFWWYSVTTEACTSPAKVCVVWRSGSWLELSVLWLVCDLNRTPIVMAKHGRPCVHFSGISTCGRTSRETVSHPQHAPLPTLRKISLPVYVIVTNERLQPLTTTRNNSLVLYFSLLKI